MKAKTTLDRFFEAVHQFTDADNEAIQSYLHENGLHDADWDHIDTQTFDSRANDAVNALSPHRKRA